MPLIDNNQMNHSITIMNKRIIIIIAIALSLAGLIILAAQEAGLASNTTSWQSIPVVNTLPSNPSATLYQIIQFFLMVLV